MEQTPKVSPVSERQRNMEERKYSRISTHGVAGRCRENRQKSRGEEEKEDHKQNYQKSMQGDPEIVLSLLSIIQVEPRQQYDLRS